MSNKESIKTWRKNLKKRAIALFGGKCVLCGYDKCVEALEFHHLDPEQKDISISSMYASPQSWQKVVSELKKCALLCANCHREEHAKEYSQKKEVQNDRKRKSATKGMACGTNSGTKRTIFERKNCSCFCMVQKS